MGIFPLKVAETSLNCGKTENIHGIKSIEGVGLLVWKMF